MEEGLLRIGELAAFSDVSPKSLRIYERMNIIKPIKVDENTGYRYYKVDQVKELNALIELKTLGFSLKEIKKIMKEKLSADEIQQVFHEKWLDWQNQILIAEHKMEAINKIADSILKADQQKDIKNLSEEERAKLLARLVCVENIAALNTISEALWL